MVTAQNYYSLTLIVKCTENVYKGFSKEKEIFDFSNVVATIIYDAGA